MHEKCIVTVSRSRTLCPFILLIPGLIMVNPSSASSTTSSTLLISFFPDMFNYKLMEITRLRIKSNCYVAIWLESMACIKSGLCVLYRPTGVLTEPDSSNSNKFRHPSTSPHTCLSYLHTVITRKQWNRQTRL